MKNGSLYYNESTRRVERVVGKLNGNRVFTVSHNYSDFGPVLKKNLRIASGEEMPLSATFTKVSGINSAILIEF